MAIPRNDLTLRALAIASLLAMAGCTTPEIRGQAPFAYGVASGDMTSESAVLWTRAAGPGNVTAELSLTPSFDLARVLPPGAASPSGDFPGKVETPRPPSGPDNFLRFWRGGDGK